MTWMDLEDIILSEISQRNTIWTLKQNRTIPPPPTKLTVKGNRFVVIRGRGWVGGGLG